MASGLWRPAFRLFFAADTISALGSAVSVVALPLLALTTLAVSETDLGLLRSAQLVPFLVLALPVGVLVDRLPRRRIMVVCDLARALLVGGVVALAALDRLAYPGLLVLAFVAGSFTVAYEICYLSVLPDLADRSRLAAANRAVELAHGGATVAGRGLGGALAGALTAAGALALDAVSFLVSGLLLLVNRWPERPHPEARNAEPLRRSVLVGARFVRRHALVGPLTAYLAVNNLFAQAFSTALLIFLVQTLALPAALVGVVVAAIGVGFLLGAALSPPAGVRLGLGPVLLGASVIGATGIGVVAATPGGVVVPAVGAALFGAGGGLYNLQSIAIRQAVTPAPLLGRVNAVVKVASYSAMALGAFLGGWLSGLTSARAVIAAAAVGSLLATACLVQPAVRRLRALPDAAGATPASSPRTDQTS